ncbi:MAG: hypothetical protein NC342_09180 [Pseudoflavonifractor sp.]|nr:hypothetical protein [Alloprevotella sp.]MCM1117692.1 hypothetical protein [Pseudoflavonifractor sp.]
MAKNYTLTVRSVAAAPRSKRRAAAVASRSGGSSSAADLSAYLTRAEFARYFELVNVGTEESPLTAIHALYEGLYTDGFLSARGEGKEGEAIPPVTPGLDIGQLDAYLTEHGYLREHQSLEGYLTKDVADGLYEPRGSKPTINAYLWGNLFTGSGSIGGTLTPDNDASLGSFISPFADAYLSGELHIGAATIKYDSSLGALRVSSPLYSDGWLSAKGAGADGATGGPAGLDTQQLAAYLNAGGYLTQGVADGRYLAKGGKAADALRADVATAAHSLVTARSLWGNSFNGSADVGGTLIPLATQAYNLGTSSRWWKDAYLSGELHIGAATISYDSATGALHLDKGLYSDGFISAKGTGQEGSAAGSASGNPTQGITIEDVVHYLLNNGVEVNALRSYGKVEGASFDSSGPVSCTHLETDSAYFSGEVAVDGDILPVDSGGCYIGSEDRPWAKGYFSDMYADEGRFDKIVFNGGYGYQNIHSDASDALYIEAPRGGVSISAGGDFGLAAPDGIAMITGNDFDLYCSQFKVNGNPVCTNIVAAGRVDIFSASVTAFVGEMSGSLNGPVFMIETVNGGRISKTTHIVLVTSEDGNTFCYTAWEGNVCYVGQKYANGNFAMGEFSYIIVKK